MKETQTISEHLIELEHIHGAVNYSPLPVVLEKGEGVHVWDVEGNKYYDFLSAYSAVNQGHCHPKIIGALKTQAEKLTLTSRAFFNNVLGPFEKYITELFDLDKVLMMNTGAEGVETAIKIARKWGYEIKGVPQNEAKIVVCTENFHGRTTTIISFSTDPDSRNNFGPHTTGFLTIPYGNSEALEKVLKEDNSIVGFLVEPIQGEAGVVVPKEGFLSESKRICKENNVLFIADEIQTGIGRTGKLLAIHHEEVKPDILILGKALSGGVYPVSAIMADAEVMDVIQPGQHGSTYGGNPLACAVAQAALEVIEQEKLTENAQYLGEIFRKEIQDLVDDIPILEKVRGKGLLNALVVDPEAHFTAKQLCLEMMKNGLIAKPTHGNIIRFAPPLVITEEQILECTEIIKKSVYSLV